MVHPRASQPCGWAQSHRVGCTLAYTNKPGGHWGQVLIECSWRAWSYLRHRKSRGQRRESVIIEVRTGSAGDVLRVPLWSPSADGVNLQLCAHWQLEPSVPSSNCLPPLPVLVYPNYGWVQGSKCCSHCLKATDIHSAICGLELPLGIPRLQLRSHILLASSTTCHLPAQTVSRDHCPRNNLNRKSHLSSTSKVLFS